MLKTICPCGQPKPKDKYKRCKKCRERIMEYRRRYCRKHPEYVIKQKEMKRKPKHPFTCVICGKKSETANPRKKTCSDECSNELRKKTIRRWHSSQKGKEYIRKKMRGYARSEKGRKKHKEYLEKHRKEINAWKRKYYKDYRKKNREKLNAYQRERRKKKNE